MKNMLIFKLSLLCFLWSCQPKVEIKSEITEKKNENLNLDSLPPGIQKLMKAYPGHFKTFENNEIVWKDGTKMPYNDFKKDKSFAQLINEADLEDQLMSMSYPKGKNAPKPKQKEDPGRVRYEAFFKKMYGTSPEEVRKKLTTVVWLPKSMNIKLQVTTVNDINLKIQAISNRLDTMPHLHKYLKNPGGTFNWRKIAGTDRLSMHSFGMTIDVNVEFSDYWRWAVKAEEGDGSRIIEYRNRIPLELVEIFEEFGFIWGGKWYHYDTMHFEYRPELLLD
jgi:hypothetical protein